MEKPEKLLPEKPTEPLESECCGEGCTPCVFDIYKQQLTKWEKSCRDIINGTQSTPSTGPDLPDIISPYEYRDYKILKIFSEPCSCSKILRLSFPENETIRPTQFPIKIGQHVLAKSGEVARKYTILRLENEFEDDYSSGWFDILVRIYETGKMTQFLNQLTVGDVL